ncbi:MAG: hypothetical protein ACFFDP_01495 [Promethearchaeota archaeon]
MSSEPQCKICGAKIDALSSNMQGGGTKQYYGLCECGKRRHRICEECAERIAYSCAKTLCQECGFPILVEYYDTQTGKTTKY